MAVIHVDREGKSLSPFVMTGLSGHIGTKSGRNLQLHVKNIFNTCTKAFYEVFPGVIGFLMILRKRYLSFPHKKPREVLKNN
jgi:hypothetical protein